MNQHNTKELYTKYELSVPMVLKRLDNKESFSAICKDLGFNRNGFSSWLSKNGYREKTKHRKICNSFTR